MVPIFPSDTVLGGNMTLKDGWKEAHRKNCVTLSAGVIEIQYYKMQGHALTD